MKATRRRSITESFESTRIVLRSGSPFRFCEMCDQCRTNIQRHGDLMRFTLEELLISGEFQIKGIERGTLVLCSKTTKS